MIRLLFSVIIVFALTPAFAELITLSRINELSPAEQTACKAYLDRSQANALADTSAVQAEVLAKKMTGVVRAPSGGGFKMHVKEGDAWFAGNESKQLADVMLSDQTPSGGWSKHLGFNKGPRQPAMPWTSQNEPGQLAQYEAKFDNCSTPEEMYFLATVWQATKRQDCRAGFIKGLKFIFAAQFPNGGWPQVYPLEGGYHDDITFNDDAMTHVLELLHGITLNDPVFDFVDESERQQVAAALATGIRCVLKTEVMRDGKKTVWCIQNDSLMLRPADARKMEPATLSGLESAHILKFLMTITNPAPEVVACIESDLKWLEAAKITGAGKTNVNGKTVYEPNAASTQVDWARFYNLTNSKPVFPSRDGILFDTFANNKVGYNYYTSQPGSIITNGQRKWRKNARSTVRKDTPIQSTT